MAKIRKIYDQTIKPDGSKVTIYPITSTRAVYTPESITMEALINEGYRFGGVIEHLADSPEFTDQRVFYLADKVGVYPNFGNLTLAGGELGVFCYNKSQWIKGILKGGGTNLTGYQVVTSASLLPDEESTIGYIIGTDLYVWVGEGGDTKEGKYKNVGPFVGPQGNGIEQVFLSPTNYKLTIDFTDGTSWTSEQSIRGIAGAKGDKGDPGLTGAAGATGPKGAKGDKGDSGVSLGEVTLTTDLDETETGKALDASAMQTIPHWVDEEQEIEDVPSNYYTKTQTDQKLLNHKAEVNQYLTNQDNDIARLEDRIDNMVDGVDEFIHHRPTVVNNGTIINAPDDEDLVATEENTLKFADRPAINAMGYVILRKNKTFAEQVTATDTIYEIRYDFDLNGGSASIPAGCTLFFNGGSLSNGTVRGNGTKVLAANYEIFRHGIVKYRMYILNDSYGVSVDTGESIVLSGTWDNSTVGSAWTGLPYFNGNTSESAELALKNYVLLHRGDVVFHERGAYYFYNGTGVIDLRRRSCDFSGSSLSIIDYANVHDSTIAIPSGATAYTVGGVETLKRIGDLIWMAGEKNYLRNLTISDRAIARGEKVMELGQVHCVRINPAHDLLIEDVVFTDVLDCAVPIASSAYNITFNRDTFEKVGEHGVYSHAYHGFLRFRDCKFIDCSLSPEVSQLRSGRSACIRNRIEDIVTGDLVVECDNCYFYCTPSSYGGTGQPFGCMTMMDTPYRSYFRNCKWEGKILGCSALVDEVLLTAYGDIPEYIFESCDAPCGIYQNQNVNNIRIRYRSCTNLRYALWYAVEITDCECVLSYISLPQNFNTTLFPNELDRHLVVSNSRFVVADDGNCSNKISSNSRSVDFNNCTFEGRTSNSHNALIELVLGDRTVSFTGCVFDVKNQRLLIITADSGTTQKLYLYSCKFKSAYSSYFMVPAGTSFEVIGCSIDSLAYSTTLSNGSDLPRHAAGNFDKNSWFVCKKKVASAKDGSVITLSGSKNMRFSTSFDITPYITVQPLSHFEDYTFTVTNNGTTSDSTITLAGPQTNGAYLVTLDLSNIGA